MERAQINAGPTPEIFVPLALSDPAQSAEFGGLNRM